MKRNRRRTKNSSDNDTGKEDLVALAETIVSCLRVRNTGDKSIFENGKTTFSVLRGCPVFGFGGCPILRIHGSIGLRPARNLIEERFGGMSASNDVDC